MTPLFAETNVHWYLPPLVVGISLVYAATRFEDWSLIIRHAIRWMVYIVVFLGGAYAILLPIAMGYRSYWYVGIVMFCLFFLSFRGGRPKPAPAAASTPPSPPVAT